MDPLNGESFSTGVCSTWNLVFTRRGKTTTDCSNSEMLLCDKKSTKRTSADTLTLLRRQYVADLLPYIQNYTNRLLDIALDIQYRPGWNQEQDFKTALDEDFEQDRMQGHTRKGPHRADLRLTEHGITVQDKFSRGQQKLLVCALRLAQIKHLKDQLEQSSVVLVDDLAAELDTYHRAQLLTLLAESGAQLFITATEMNLITTGGWSSQKVFHVEHGQIVEVV